MSSDESLPYPKSVFIIVVNEFCERFCYYGLRAILAIYFTNFLLYTENSSKIVYHTFCMLAYFFPLVGGIIADTWLGKFKTIFFVSILYACGGALLSLASVTPLHLPANEFSLLGLVIVAMGTGGIKPCVSAFGGDQFILPQQEAQLKTFFSMFYFSINAGSLISTLITPIFREKIHCFDEDSCYPFAFGFPSFLMIVATVIFVLGKPFYRQKEPGGNVMLEVSKCILTAIRLKIKSKGVKKDHWLDFALEEYGEKMVGDIKLTLKILVLFTPLPVFWALFDQQGSGWTFQARRMNGDVGPITILPEQIHVLNPLFVLLLIPVFQYSVYPLLTKFSLVRTPLQRIVCGGVLTAISFLISACISLALESTYPTLPGPNNAQLRIYNSLSCTVKISILSISGDIIEIEQGQFYSNIDLKVEGQASIGYSATSSCQGTIQGEFELWEEQASGYFFQGSKAIYFQDDVSKEYRGYPKIRTLVNGGSLESVEYINEKGAVKISTNSSDTSLYSLYPGTYTFKIAGKGHEIKLGLGGVYAILAVGKGGSDYEIHKIESTPPNSIHMLLLIPQYLVITTGEIMFSITGLEFSYSQAPNSMKSVLQSMWLVTVAFGNVIVIIESLFDLFPRESLNFFLYGTLMLIDMGIFAAMAMRYRYVTIATED